MAETKPKILIFSLAYHPFVGGAEVAIKEITDRLPDFDFEMITVNLTGREKSEEKIGNILIYRLGRNRWSKYLFPWSAYKKARKLHQKKNYQAIWAMMANQAGWAARKFKKQFPSVKYLLTLQEGDSEWDILWRTALIRPIYKAIYRRADTIQAISGFLAQRAKNLGAKCSIEVVPNGINMNYESEVKNDESNNKTIITASRLAKKNSVEYLIKAVKLLVTDYQLSTTLLILGRGKLEERLKGLTENLNLSDRVKFRGEVKNDEVYNQLRQSAVFVRPSLSEGLGNAFLEAMAAGIPVIGTPVGGIPDFLCENKLGPFGQTGWFCKVKNPRSIAEKISYVLDEKNKTEVAETIVRAKRMVSEKYNWADIAKQMDNIFSRLIGQTK